MHFINNDFDYFADQTPKSSNVRTPLRNVVNFENENANWRSPLMDFDELDGENDQESVQQIESEDDQEQRTPAGRKKYQKAVSYLIRF